jgi:hypothetical protein
MMKKKAESQFLLAFIFLLSVVSCSSYNVTVSDSEKDDERYSQLFHNSDYHINFHSYGGRYLENLPFYRKYGKQVFTYSQYLKKENDKRGGKNVHYGLYIVKKVPNRIIKANDTIITKLYKTSVTCFNENYKVGQKNIYKRYFTIHNTNYLFVGIFKRFYKDKHEIYQYHMDQEMEGLEL